MRKITAGPVLVFLCFLMLAIAAAIFSTSVLIDWLPLGDFRGVTGVLFAVVLVYVFALFLYRLYLRFRPLTEGLIAEGTREEFAYHVYLLFYLILFHPLTRGLFIPVPLMRVIYLALGARLGANTYSAGTILDPPLTRMGDNGIIGHDAVLFCHAIEGSSLSHAAIIIGHNVTIGAKAVIMSGVTIADGAVVAVNAVVTKNTRIGAGELWGGTPARKIGLARAAADNGA